MQSEIEAAEGAAEGGAEGAAEGAAGEVAGGAAAMRCLAIDSTQEAHECQPSAAAAVCGREDPTDPAAPSAGSESAPASASLVAAADPGEGGGTPPELDPIREFISSLPRWCRSKAEAAAEGVRTCPDCSYIVCAECQGDHLRNICRCPNSNFGYVPGSRGVVGAGGRGEGWDGPGRRV